MEGGSRGTNLIHIEKLQLFVAQIGLICEKSFSAGTKRCNLTGQI